ncbi:type II toxin-antitoxin system HicB family antitoxin [bacterium]|nr:type II toxin-antitoxin system HicB family antitoxin [FCB group bacterium]MBL7190758.1 type II toxin-antitoxin system HicB family antitoxin [bacterium]
MLLDPEQISLRQDEDGVWIANSVLLPGCHAFGESKHEAILNFQEAAIAHLIALKDSGRPIPEAFRDKFVLTA